MQIKLLGGIKTPHLNWAVLTYPILSKYKSKLTELQHLQKTQSLIVFEYRSKEPF
jgi:hypothetical protein